MPKTSQQIPTPTGDKQPQKVNVYSRAAIINSQLTPMFPFFDEGSIVPALASFRGGAGKRFGRFQHFNTVDEIVILFGAQGGRAAPGAVRIGPKLHMVGVPFEDPEDPNSLVLLTITQRQSIGKKQSEEVRFLCDECDRRLTVYKYDATPPKRGAQREELGEHTIFKTTEHSYEAARLFNEDEDARICKHCGHTNPPFPEKEWGWSNTVQRDGIVQSSLSSMKMAHEKFGTPAETEKAQGTRDG